MFKILHNLIHSRPGIHINQNSLAAVKVDEGGGLGAVDFQAFLDSLRSIVVAGIDLAAAMIADPFL